MKTEKIFPNGFPCWQETHYEVVQAITELTREGDLFGILKDRHDQQGYGGFYELAEELTDEFEKAHVNVIWDGDYFYEIEKFLNEKLK